MKRVMQSGIPLALAAVLTAWIAAGASSPASAQLQWSTKDEKMSFKVGILGQLQGESVDVAGTKDSAQNLFFRRLRLLMGFNLSDKLSIFLDTDSPNLGKSSNAGVKDTGNVFIQDFVATYKFSQAFQIDGGLLLMDQTYNHNQSAATLLATDYGPYTFVESTPLQARTGRDYGIRARGYLLDNHLEYRAGVYDGLRGTNAANNLRYSARLMYSFFTPPVGLFYRGSSLGKTRTLSIGATYDAQQKYDSTGFDVFFDQPLGGGNALVLQGDYQEADGGTFAPTLAKQKNSMIEAGIYLSAIKLQPFVQYASQNFDATGLVDENRTTVGLGYFVSGYGNNIKLSYTKIDPKNGKARDQINLQWQIFQF